MNKKRGDRLMVAKGRKNMINFRTMRKNKTLTKFLEEEDVQRD